DRSIARHTQPISRGHCHTGEPRRARLWPRHREDRSDSAPRGLIAASGRAGGNPHGSENAGMRHEMTIARGNGPIRWRRRMVVVTASLATVATTGATARTPSDPPMQGLPLWRYTTELSLEMGPVRLAPAPAPAPLVRGLNAIQGPVVRGLDAVQVVANSQGQMFVVQT